MPDSSHGIPPKGGNGGLIVGGIIMLLLAGGLVAYKMSSSSSEPEVIEQKVVAKAPAPEPTAVLDNAPPPPPTEEELEEEEKKTEEDESKKTVGGTYKGPAGCSGQCSGSAGADLVNALSVRAAGARSCYNTALRRNANLEGKMTVNLRVSPSGAVCSTSVSNNTLGDPAVAACVKAQFRASQFPKPSGGCVDMAAPLNFTSKK